MTLNRISALLPTNCWDDHWLSYNTTLDELYIKMVVARLASFRNVWWSMANEWNQLECYWKPPTPNPCANSTHQRDGSDPGCGYGGSNR